MVNEIYLLCSYTGSWIFRSRLCRYIGILGLNNGNITCLGTMKALNPVASARHYGSNNRKSMRQRK